MKARIALLFVVLACLYTQAQVPSSFFAMTPQLSGSPTSYTAPYPELTITSIDSNFTTASPVVGLLGHPTTFAWGWVETSAGVYDWSTIDPVLSAANAQGVGVILTLAQTPQWEADTSSTGSCSTGTTVGGKTALICTYPPISYVGATSDWGVFIKALMDHLYGVDHILTFSNPVKYIELWNEANTAGFWGPSSTSGHGLSILASMAATAYPIIHNYSLCTPNCPLVLSPSAVGAASGPVPATGVDPIVSDWIHQYLTTGSAASNLDGIAFHGYLHTAPQQHAWPESYWTSSFGSCTLGTICNSGPSFRTCPSDGVTVCYGPLDTLVTNIRAAVTSAGVSTSKPLVDTEGSWGQGDLDGASGMNPALPLDTAYVARWYLLQAGVAATSGLKAASWYFWDPSCNYVTKNCLGLDYGELGYLSAGTLFPFGTAGKTSAPGSGLGLGWLWKWLKGSTVTSACAATPQTGSADLWSCALTLPSGRSARVVWSTASGTETYTNANFSMFQDLTGCLQSYTTHVSVGADPIIVLKQNEGWGSNTCI